MPRPTALTHSSTLEGYFAAHREAPDLSYDAGEADGAALFVGRPNNPIGDDFYIVEVTGHPDGLRFFAAPNFDPSTAPSAAEVAEQIIADVQSGEHQLPRPVAATLYRGQYTATLEDAVALCRQWRDLPFDAIPKEYLHPITPVRG